MSTVLSSNVIQNDNRIILLAIDFPPLAGGISRYLFDIANSVAHSELEVITLPVSDSTNFDRSHNLKINRIFWPIRQVSYSSQIKYSAPLYFVNLIKQRKPDFLICGQAHYTLLLPAWFYSKLTGIPFGVFTHGFDLKHPQKRFYRQLFNFLLLEANVVFTNSKATRDIALSIGVKSNQISIIRPFIRPKDNTPCLVPHEVLQRHKLRNKKCILTVGRLVERKGHDIVLRSLPQIIQQNPDVHYLIVGQGPYENTLKSLVSTMGLDSYVTFAGFVPDNELSAYYQIANVFVMISRDIPEKGDTEGFGIVYLEANQFKLPVVAGRTGGVEDAVVDGKTGLLVDPNSCEQVASAISTLLGNQALAQQLGINGWQRVQVEFNGNTVGNRITQILAAINCI